MAPTRAGRRDSTSHERKDRHAQPRTPRDMLFPSGVTHNFSRYLYVLLPALLCIALEYPRTARLGTPLMIVLIGWLALRSTRFPQHAQKKKPAG
jgi:hypothetical protein